MYDSRSKSVRIVKKKGRLDKLIKGSNKLPTIGIVVFIVGLVLVLFHPLSKGLFTYTIAQRLTQEEARIVDSFQEASSSAETVAGGPFQIDSTLLQEVVGSEDIPQRVIIPSVSIDLSVTPAKVVDGLWETSETTASFGLGSTPPGKIGNTVIFAHARIGLFANLRNVKKDALVYVLNQNNWYAYKIEEIKTVSPTDIEVIKPTASETLTLYTCSGFADTKRLIVQGKRI